MVIAWLATNLPPIAWVASGMAATVLAAIWEAFRMPSAFPAATAGIMAEAALAYLVCKLFMLIGLWLQNRRVASGDYLKIFLSSCGGHVTFASQNLASGFPCPHCQSGYYVAQT